MRGWVAKLVAVVAVLVAVGFIGLAGIGGRLYWNRVERQGEESAIAKLAPTDAKLRPGLA
jgi:Mce-associated membrane protein